MRQTLQLLCILLDPRITAAPVRTLRELRRRGVRRLPREVEPAVDGLRHRGRALRFAREWLATERLTRHRGQWVINSFMPPFPGRAYERMFENLLSGRHLSPVSAYLAVTGECPCRCWHCSLAHRDVSSSLPRETWESVIDQLQALGVSLIGFTGGEPLLRSDLDELVARAARGGATPVLFTCGLGLDDARARRLADAGLWACGVSLDHDEEAECDRLRGRAGAYRAALAALRAARKAGLYTMTGTVATRSLIESGRHERIYRLAAELRVHECRFIEPMPCGRLAAADALLRPEHTAALRAFHAERNRSRGGPKVCAFNQIESPEVFGCGGGTQHLFVDAAGEVCPCDFTPLSFGNVRDRPLARIWERMNRAMGDNPRAHCFIQKHHGLIAARAAGEWPLPPEISEAICRAAGPEPLPAYFDLVVNADSATTKAPRKDE